MKVDVNGDSVWVYNYGVGDQFFDFCTTSDGGYIISDLNYDLIVPRLDAFTALKLDESRNEIWHVDLFYNSGPIDTSAVGRSVCEMPNNEGYVVAGQKSYFVDGEPPEMWFFSQLFLMYLDTDGNDTLQLYEEEFGAGDRFPITPLDMKVTDDGNYLIGGYVNGDFDELNYNWARPDKVFIAEIEGNPMTSVDDEQNPDLPGQITLLRNYPNPFNATTQIFFDLAQTGNIRVEIYNLLGQRVETLIDSEQPPGKYSIPWDASNITSGIYFYKLTIGDRVLTRRMTLLK